MGQSSRAGHFAQIYTMRTEHKNVQTNLTDHLFLCVIVSITGAAVMMIELMGTRIIGPFYGVSLFVWSSLISVTLLALAIGYYVGGLLADKQGVVRLSHVIFLAAIFTGIIPLMSPGVLSATNSLGLRAGAFTSAFILFSPCLVLLGMAGPFVIKMATSRLESVGFVVGSVYAVSTLGSVIGTLLLGFYLLPLAGIKLIILCISLVLLGLSLMLAIYELRRLQLVVKPILWMMSSLAVAIVLTSVYLLHEKHIVKNYRVLSDVESHDGWIRVVDQPYERIRWLLSDSSTIGAESLDTGNGLLSYQRIVGLLPDFLPDAKNALLIGLGSGHLVGVLDRKGITTDTIEINPEVARVASKYFNFKPTGDLIIGDARYQVTKLDKQYDIIIHDCFTGGTEPIHLLSVEMIQTLNSLLKDNGVLALNMIGFLEGPDKISVAAVALTLDAVFSHRRVFVSEPGKDFNDIVFLVSNSPTALKPKKNNQLIEKKLTKKEISIDTKNAFVVTDDYNPLESLQVAKAEHYRELLMKRLGAEILIR
ncbi:MAG: fused MFS/spermidine synthase [Methylococcales bacterium]